MQGNTDIIKCPECGIEAHVEGGGSEKSFSFSQEEMARRCKYSGSDICPYIREVLDRLRYSILR